MESLIQKIHDAPHRTVIATAGAGSSALSHLLSVAGASRTLLESIVPYSQAAFDDFLGKPPKQYVSDGAARLLAGRAYARASQLERGDFPLVGLGCTATIVTDRHKKGEHRGYVATWQPHQLNTYSIVLQKGERNRAEEEAIYSLIMINALATACGLAEQLPLPLYGDEVVEKKCYDFAAVTQQLHDQDIPFFALHDNGRIRTDDVCPQTILSGSFNPLHAGHLGMARAASHLLDRPVAFELSAVNVDKPPIPPNVVMKRIAQFAGRHPIYVSNAPTYVQKSRLYPGATFIIGYDTAIRLFVTKYYNDSQQEMEAAMDEFSERDCSFLVAGRVNESGEYRSLADVAVPDQYQHLFQAIPEKHFRMDISSSEIRAQRNR